MLVHISMRAVRAFLWRTLSANVRCSGFIALPWRGQPRAIAKQCWYLSVVFVPPLPFWRPSPIARKTENTQPDENKRQGTQQRFPKFRNTYLQLQVTVLNLPD